MLGHEITTLIEMGGRGGAHHGEGCHLVLLLLLLVHRVGGHGERRAVLLRRARVWCGHTRRIMVRGRVPVVAHGTARSREGAWACLGGLDHGGALHVGRRLAVVNGRGRRGGVGGIGALGAGIVRGIVGHVESRV